MNAVTIAAPLEITRQFDTSLAETWRYWTEPELLSQWFAPGKMRCEVPAWELAAGGAYRIHMVDEDGSTHTVGGKFLEIEHERRLRKTWAWEGSDAPESLVTIEFSAHADGTRVDILHEGLDTDENVAAHREGWIGCLDRYASK